MDSWVAWGLAGAAGAAVAGPLFVLAGTDPLLTAAVALSYATVARLSLCHPDTVYEPDVPAWRVGRWSGLTVALLLAVALFGVNGSLPVDDGTLAGLRALVLGAGYAAWLLGISYARAKGGG